MWVSVVTRVHKEPGSRSLQTGSMPLGAERGLSRRGGARRALFSLESFQQDRRSLPSGLITLQGPLSMPASPVGAAFATTRLSTPTLGRGGGQGGVGCRTRGRGRLSMSFLSFGLPRLWSHFWGRSLGSFHPCFILCCSDVHTQSCHWWGAHCPGCILPSWT